MVTLPSSRYIRSIKSKWLAWGISDNQFSGGASLGALYDARWIQNDYVVFYAGEEDLLK